MTIFGISLIKFDLFTAFVYIFILFFFAELEFLSFSSEKTEGTFLYLK